MENWQVYKEAVDYVGAKKVSHALNLSLSMTYRLAQPVYEDGVRSDLDRLEMLVDVAASDPNARPFLIRMRNHIDGWFRRTLDRETPVELTPDRVAEKAGHICAEVGDLLKAMKPDYDAAEVDKEASEVIAAIDRLMKSLHQKPCKQFPPQFRVEKNAS